MRELILKMSVSLDGFVAGPAGETEWIFRSSSPDSRASVLETLLGAGAHAMGGGAYRAMAAFWPAADSPMAAPMNEIPKIVFSRSGLRECGVPSPSASPSDAAAVRSWAEPAVASGDLSTEIARLKAEPGSYVLAHGGASFARALVAADVVDEYRLAVHPIALGRGLPLFTDLARPADLRLVRATPFSGGIVGLVYRPASSR